MTKIAIIGAGISGLTLAKELAEQATVIVFEKARGTGGRMSSRRAEPFYFDHGAQCFTARTAEFQEFLKPYFNQGIVNEWQGKVINLEFGKKTTKRLWFEPHLVASPNMNSLCKAMAEGIDIRTSCEVAPVVDRIDERWHLKDSHGSALGAFDWVISTAPPEQTSRLFDVHISADHTLRSVTMRGCFALMLGFNVKWDKTWIAAKVRDNPIKWISVNSSKPGRDQNVTCLVVHSRNDWTDKHIDDDLASVQTTLMEQFTQVTGIDPNHADYLALHRWRYAIVHNAEKTGAYIDSNLKLGATSDWCQTSRIEEVWLHAKDLAHQIVSGII